MTISKGTARPSTSIDEHNLIDQGISITCDSCNYDLNNSVRIKCADPACEEGDGVDICPSCFCYGKEFKQHKRIHSYRVIDIPSYPIYTEDWGADEELRLIDGALLQGLGNWQAISEHVGNNRTKDDVEKHYRSVYIDSPDWPLPSSATASREFDIEQFHARKKRRLNEAPHPASVLPKGAPTSAPGFHEVATFLPGRLEFEHELDNDAEELIKDLEFGLVYQFGGDAMPEDEDDLDVKAKRLLASKANGHANGNGDAVSLLSAGEMEVETKYEPEEKPPDSAKSEKAIDKDKDKDKEDKDDAPHVPLPIETEESVAFKLALIEMYFLRVEKRHEAKGFIFERGLLEYKKMQATEKKRHRDEKDLVHRYRPYAKLQTADDYETWVDGMLYEATLRKRIAMLQSYRRNGLTSLQDTERYDGDLAKRIQSKANLGREYSYTERRGILPIRGSSAVTESEGRKSRERDSTPLLNGAVVNGAAQRGRGVPAPLNLANSPSLGLLTPAEQTLCSQLRILPKPYLVIKEILVGAYIKSGGTLRKREARNYVKVDVNKTSRLWDFFQQSGWLQMPEQVPVAEAMSVDSVGPQPTLTRENSAQSAKTFPVNTGMETPPMSSLAVSTSATSI